MACSLVISQAVEQHLFQDGILADESIVLATGKQGHESKQHYTFSSVCLVNVSNIHNWTTML